ncbi:hypothetical protein BOX30_03515 [Leptospirillum ferriphilum]|uniref:Uncharacterized protein n=2 Tax=Leptospirillum ferriphilum TaxID=178606 RepID=A0A1V3SX92_9BACT|nr:hypothetical protein LFML04_0510 [Leptospirillum ferriphilum ML-04]OOH72902.1 hypothetical protein BOX24_05840 [Leptospirillum ferriphilum]OOH82302.1 hypothetical protein BOX30_03515 [Leptospirillum ferriphilum]
MAALNIPAPENTGGDWHFVGTFRSPSFPNNIGLAGEGLDWNTNALFGEYGIHECSDSLRCRGISIPEGTRVYSTNHYRAILDMLARSVSKGQVPRHLAISDWLDTDEHLKIFFRLLDRFFDRFSPSEQNLVSVWIESQCQSSRREWREDNG